MKREFFLLTQKVNDCQRLAVAIALNANFSEAARQASEPYLPDCLKEAYKLEELLNEVLAIQSRSHAAQKK